MTTKRFTKYAHSLSQTALDAQHSLESLLTPDAEPMLQAVAKQEIIKAEGEGEVTPSAVTMLTSHLNHHLREVRDLIASQQNDFDKENPVPRLVSSSEEKREWARRAILMWLRTDALWLDEIGARYLSDNLGRHGAENARAILDASREAVAELRRNETTENVKNVFRRWFDAKAPHPVRFAGILAHVIWKARPAPPSAKSYVLLSKPVGAASHMAGAAPHEIKSEEYGLVPEPQGYVAHSSRSLIMLDGHKLDKSAQAVLPIAHPRDDETLPESLMGREVGLSVIGYKIALIIMASPHALRGGEISALAKEWVQLVYPGARYRARHLVPVVESFFLIPRPYIYLPGPNPGWAGMFDTFVGTNNPGAITPDSVLAASLRRRFCEHVNAAMHGGPGDTWRGSFMLNMAAALALPNNQPEPLRLHVTAARQANAARYRADHLRYESIDMIAARVNAFAPGVAEKLKANKKLTRSSGSAAMQRSRARGRIKDSFDLFAGEGIWVVDKRGKSDEYRLLPTRRDRDARSDFRRRGPNPI